jgi:hypothetical protein
MSELGDQPDDGTMRQAVRAVQQQHALLVGVGTVFAPAVFTLSLVFRSEFTHGVLFWGLVGGSVVVWVATAIVTATAPSTPLATLQDLRASERTLAATQRELDHVTRVAMVNTRRLELVRGWNDLAAAYTADGRVDTYELETALRALLDVLVRHPEEVFQLAPQRGFWSASIYVHNTASDRLCALERATNRGLQPTHLGRTWRPGDGHVGFAYQQNQAMVVDDLTASEISKLIETSDNQRREQDRQLYRCMAAVPLRSGHRLESPGVLIVTSDTPNTLSEEADGKLLQAAAAHAATLLTLHAGNTADMIQTREKEGRYG